ncbi:MAG: NAD-dependent deacylase [Chlorobi bacterium]|nr:MAG: NAD-dependent deacylase [Bacteroidota bacterium]KXK34335.1 MAG: SIR2 family NAD-dependent protein deacetylase [Chlorobi bacterium OLB6]MBE2264620.1 NAD-dependent deacylase [Flavobacteriales bacterium]MBL1160158.1 NAD-dependent deacylase [Chlorobiota bacterium]MBW7853295.1 NAD-dependent deacylase [Candidatus Kapabacteria bacterium]MCC6332191.1 NAD-dependent deacylase [Ignavibacteria bacterium]
MPSETTIQHLCDAMHVCVLTGAGVSAESGVATFRDPDGLWAKFSPQELASMDGFLANPERVRDWYTYRLHVIDSVTPNRAHTALATLEQHVPKLTLITQNVDRLHQQAGSRNVVELHGNLLENRCNGCGWLTDAHKHVEICIRCGDLMRPNVVWFGEMLPVEAIEQATEAARTCDVFICIGTSAEVYPAAQLPYDARNHGAYLVEINPNQTVLTPYAHQSIRHTAVKAVSELVERFLNKRNTHSPPR